MRALGTLAFGDGEPDEAGPIEHILHDAEPIGFVSWSFDPGAGREPSPGSLRSHPEDMAVWTAAGMPPPGEPSRSAHHDPGP